MSMCFFIFTKFFFYHIHDEIIRDAAVQGDYFLWKHVVILWNVNVVNTFFDVEEIFDIKQVLNLLYCLVWKIGIYITCKTASDYWF